MQAPSPSVFASWVLVSTGATTTAVCFTPIFFLAKASHVGPLVIDMLTTALAISGVPRDTNGMRKELIAQASKTCTGTGTGGRAGEAVLS